MTLSYPFEKISSLSAEEDTYSSQRARAETKWRLPDEHQHQYQTLFLVAGLVGLWVFLYFYNSKGKLQPHGMPILNNPTTGERSFPFIGHAINMVKYRPWDLLAKWHGIYGPIVCFPLLGSNFFSVASPELAKLVFQSKIASIKKDIAGTMKPFLSILGTGIVTAENEAWMKQRLKMSHPLRTEVLSGIPTQTLAAVQRLMETMDEACEQGEAVPIGSLLRHLTLQVISGTFLSLSADESDSTFAKMYLPIVDESNIRIWHPYRTYLIFLPAFWLYIYNVHRLNRYMSQLIRRRSHLRQREKKLLISHRPIDILDRVLSAHEKEFPTCSVLSDEAVRQIRDEMKTFILAGHETSAAMMTWTLYELMGHHSLMGDVATESDRVFDKHMDWRRAKSIDLPSNEKLSQLELSEACLKESLRKYSVVPIVARRTIQDLCLQNRYMIPKGSSLMVNIQAVHLNPEIWPKPMKFDPSRFLGDRPIAPYTFLAFIAGPRNCLGQYLALLESKIVVSLLTQRYHFELPTGHEIEVNDWSGGRDPRHRYMVPVIPKTELMALLKQKRKVS